MSVDSVAMAWREVIDDLPEGWAVSVTHVPFRREWGCTASPVGPRAHLELIQSGTHLTEAAALRDMAGILRRRRVTS